MTGIISLSPTKDGYGHQTDGEYSCLRMDTHPYITNLVIGKYAKPCII